MIMNDHIFIDLARDDLVKKYCRSGFGHAGPRVRRLMYPIYYIYIYGDRRRPRDRSRASRGRAGSAAARVGLDLPVLIMRARAVTHYRCSLCSCAVAAFSSSSTTVIPGGCAHVKFSIRRAFLGPE